MGFFYNRDTLYAQVAVYNREGRTGAYSIQIAGKMDFWDSVSTDYSAGEFRSPDKTVLPAFNPQLEIWNPHAKQKTNERALIRVEMTKRIPIDQNVVYKNRLICTWGKIRYKDRTGEWRPPVQFCRCSVAALVFEKGKDGTPADTDCDTQKPNPNQ